MWIKQAFWVIPVSTASSYPSSSSLHPQIPEKNNSRMPFVNTTEVWLQDIFSLSKKLCVLTNKSAPSKSSFHHDKTGTPGLFAKLVLLWPGHEPGQRTPDIWTQHGRCWSVSRVLRGWLVAAKCSASIVAGGSRLRNETVLRMDRVKVKKSWRQNRSTEPRTVYFSLPLSLLSSCHLLAGYQQPQTRQFAVIPFCILHLNLIFFIVFLKHFIFYSSCLTERWV